MDSDKLLLERGVVTTLRFNRPDVGNVLDDDGLSKLAAMFQQVARDQECRVLVITGVGEVFCRGRDPKGSRLGPNPSAYARRESLARITAVNKALHDVAAVTIAAVNGDALGFGCGLALQADLTLTTDDASFGFPEIDAGLPPTLVMSYLGRYIPRKHAAELVLTGRRLSADQAREQGLVNHVVARSAFDGQLTRLVETLIEKDPVALRTAKQFLNDVQDMTVEQASLYGVNVLSVALSAKSDA
jgi:enoyl-CoA hydratase/carnithine racemase